MPNESGFFPNSPATAASPWRFGWWFNAKPDQEGIVLADVHFNGHLVLRKASLPRLLTHYNPDVPVGYGGPDPDVYLVTKAGAFSDGLHNDSDITYPGLNPPKVVSVFTGTDNGMNAVFLQANFHIGLYLLTQKWILREDGSIGPRMASQGLQHPGDHRHHIYWRLNFNIDSSQSNAIQEFHNVPGLATTLQGHVILFDHEGFHGPHKHVFAAEPHLDAWDDSWWNDKTSSIVVLAGNWEFYEDSDFLNPHNNPPVVLGPGLYARVWDFGIPNDRLSSLRPSTLQPTSTGLPLADHIIVFTNRDLDPDHRHIFGQEPNLNAADDNGFNDAVTAAAILGGNWQFADDSNYVRPFGPILGPGFYDSVDAVGVRGSRVSSLRSVPGAPTISEIPISAEVVLFADQGMHGPHRHVFKDQPALNWDFTSSIVVGRGLWTFFHGKNFTTPYPDVELLGRGIYPFVVSVGIANDDIRSLRPVPPPPGFRQGWTTRTKEFATIRAAGNERGWRVINTQTQRGYYIVAGPHDGMADYFSKHDIWGVLYHANEDNHDQGRDVWNDHVSDFVNGENIDGQDIVFWYCAHLLHLYAEGPDEVHEGGPDLIPFGNWAS
jgi:hypothetical protein